MEVINELIFDIYRIFQNQRADTFSMSSNKCFQTVMSARPVRFDPDLLQSKLGILVAWMNQGLCASCKTRLVAGKRKDAIYCTDPKCRKDAHLKRKEQAAQLPPTLSANKSSLIITFPDGRRCLIELTLLIQ